MPKQKTLHQLRDEKEGAETQLPQEHGKGGKDGKVFIDTLKLPPCLVPLYPPTPHDEMSPGYFHLQEDFE